MSSYRVNGKEYTAETSDLQPILSDAYHNKHRPRCLCQRPNELEMYIAHVNGQYIVKRMPDTGRFHHPSCDHYEPPAELSGRGELLGQAIREDLSTGEMQLAFAFNLSKRGSRATPTQGTEESDTVRTDGKKLTLRAMLHTLWDDAEFSKWRPNMAGKRSWATIHKFLLENIAGKTVAKCPLCDLLYIPEPFREAQKQEINARRQVFFNGFAYPGIGVRKLAIVLGEVRDMGEARYGHKILVGHVNEPFMVNNDLYRRLQKRFETELALWEADKRRHLLINATFSYSSAGICSLEEAALVLTNENWIPAENNFELQLLAELTRTNRRFTKSLRYQLPSEKPIASVTLTDAGLDPVALFVIPPGVTDQYRQSLSAMAKESPLKFWQWDISAGPMPDLPSAARR